MNENIWISDDGRVVVRFAGGIERWSRSKRCFVWADGYTVIVDGRALYPWKLKHEAITLAKDIAREREGLAA